MIDSHTQATPWTQWARQTRIVGDIGRRLRIDVGRRLIEVTGDITVGEIQAALDEALVRGAANENVDRAEVYR